MENAIRRVERDTCYNELKSWLDIDMNGMNGVNRNFIIYYSLLVGLPVLGLFGILKAGHNLAAPVSVGGDWSFEIAAEGVAESPCLRSVFASREGLVSISQSGKRLALVLDDKFKTTASGVIEGDAIRLSAPSLPGGPADCGGNFSLLLTATADRDAEPKVMTGLISFNECPACSPVEFRAIRQPRAAVR